MVLERWLAGLLLAAAMLLPSGACRAEDIVTQVSGGARGAQGQLALLGRLPAGGSVTLDDGAILVLFRVEQGKQFTLTGPGQFTLGVAGPERRGAGGSVRVDRPHPGLARVLQRRDQVVAGAVLRATLATPAGIEEERVAPSQPFFSWRARPHRGDWQFRLTDEDGQPLFETTLAATELSLPSTIRLAPGQVYLRELRWQDRHGTTRTDVLRLRALDAAADAELAALYPAPGADQAARVLVALYLRGLGVQALAHRLAPELEPDLYP